MTAFATRVAAVTGVGADAIQRLSGGDLSEVLLVRRPSRRLTVAKGGAATGTEAAMLRAIAGAGVAAPAVEGEHDGVLLIEHVPNDGIFSDNAWASIGAALKRLHSVVGDGFGWPVDYQLGSVGLDNRQGRDWGAFWTEQRLIATASVLDRPWRGRLDGAAAQIAQILPSDPTPVLLHGDLWSGNILVRDGALAALVDPACYHGHAEVDLAMLTLFDSPSSAFWSAYGPPEEGWEERRAAYQLFPALVHLRLFGAAYANMVDRLLTALGA